MGSETDVLKLPIIDFSDQDLESNGAKWESVKSQVLKALVDYGCFEAVYDEVPLDLRKALFAEVEEVFDLPLETKKKLVSSKPFHGYRGPLHRYESMGIEDAHVSEKVESFAKILWPEEGKPSLSKNLCPFTEKVSKLDQIIREMILASLGVKKYLDEHMKSTYCFTHLIKYKGPQTNDKQVGLRVHTDKNTLTILCQNQVDGLEVQTKSGEWIRWKPSSSHSFFAIVGDSLYAWTNGWLHAPLHRVMMSGSETKFTIGLFTIPNIGCIIKAPEELVTEDHPLLFKPFVHSEFMKFLYANEDIENALNVYCGI